MLSQVVKVRMSEAEVARFDELAAARRTTRSSVLRSVLREESVTEEFPAPSRERALAMLAAAAEAGSVVAMVGEEFRGSGRAQWRNAVGGS
jgi:predicted transcriptional regulator